MLHRRLDELNELAKRMVSVDATLIPVEDDGLHFGDVKEAEKARIVLLQALIINDGLRELGCSVGDIGPAISDRLSAEVGAIARQIG